MSVLSHGGVPGGLLVKNPPSIAVDTGAIPDHGTKIPCAVGQLIPHAATRISPIVESVSFLKINK